MLNHPPTQVKGFNPYGDLIGLTLSRLDEGHSQFTLEVNGRLRNPYGVLHGGVISSMADTGMGAALYTCLNDGESCATAEIKITYLRAVTSGTLICDTKVIHKGRRIAFLESEVWNSERLVAKASGTYSIFQARK
ncbi:MAG: PaaI family thioesterase [Anaerolineae bacterium]